MSPQTAHELTSVAIFMLMMTWMALLFLGLGAGLVWIVNRSMQATGVESAHHGHPKKQPHDWVPIIALIVAILSLISSTVIGIAQLAYR